MSNSPADLKCSKVLCEAPQRLFAECLKEGRYYFQFSNKNLKDCEAYALWYLNHHIPYDDKTVFVNCGDDSPQSVSVIMCNPD